MSNLKETILDRLHESAGIKYRKGTSSTLPDILDTEDVLQAIDLDNKYQDEPQTASRDYDVMYKLQQAGEKELDQLKALNKDLTDILARLNVRFVGMMADNTALKEISLNVTQAYNDSVEYTDELEKDKQELVDSLLEACDDIMTFSDADNHSNADEASNKHLTIATKHK